MDSVVPDASRQLQPRPAPGREWVALGWRLALLCWLLNPLLVAAHEGRLNVVYEGKAGPYPVRVVIQPPGVVPGLADISVRVMTNGTQTVTVLPVHWKAGLEGAPPPDLARPVPGDPSLHSAALWLMTAGAYTVHVEVSGQQGRGTLMVPVNSIALGRLEMNTGFAWLLAGLGLFLFLLMVSIVGAAVRESMLEPGARPTRLGQWAGRGAMLLVSAVLVLGLMGGKSWWESVDRDYQERRMYQPFEVVPAVTTYQHQKMLRLDLLPPDQGRWESSPLVPDHGKLMHLYLTRRPDQDAFAHLHPVRTGDRLFQVLLPPPLPPGDYRGYADITHESGFSQTLPFEFRLEASPPPALETPPAFLEPDPDDSWLLNGSPGRGQGATVQLPSGHTITMDPPKEIVAGRDFNLTFTVRDAQGGAVRLKPYLGMFSHAALIRTDGEVFLHLHPVGTVSLAAQQVATLRAQGRSAKIITAEALEPFCKDPPPEEGDRPLIFPCLVPQPGRYRIWVQIRPVEEVETAVFNLNVLSED